MAMAPGLGATPVIANLGLIHFLAFFGIYGAFTFDFHSNVVAAMAIPWYGLALHKRRSTEAWLLLFMLSAKENMGIWLFSWCWVSCHERKETPPCGSFWLGFGRKPDVERGGDRRCDLRHFPMGRIGLPALGDGPIVLGYMAIHPIQVFQALLDGGSDPGRAKRSKMLVLLFLAGGWPC
jgi:hypothetical protein